MVRFNALHVVGNARQNASVVNKVENLRAPGKAIQRTELKKKEKQGQCTLLLSRGNSQKKSRNPWLCFNGLLKFVPDFQLVISGCRSAGN